MLPVCVRVKGLKHRREKDEAVAAYFTHIGDLYHVHHLWCEYTDIYFLLKNLSVIESGAE